MKTILSTYTTVLALTAAGMFSGFSNWMETEPENIEGLSQKEEILLRGTLDVVSEKLDVDVLSILNVTPITPLYVQNYVKSGFVHIAFNADDFTEHQFSSWVNNQNWDDKWVTYDTDKSEKIWGVEDNLTGKESPSGGIAFETDGTVSEIAIWVN